MSSTTTASLRERTAAEVRAEMARQRKTGNELASLLHVSQQSASRRMNAETRMSLDELEKIAGWLSVPVHILLGSPAHASVAS